jgi:hypothetical protein
VLPFRLDLRVTILVSKAIVQVGARVKQRGRLISPFCWQILIRHVKKIGMRPKKKFFRICPPPLHPHQKWHFGDASQPFQAHKIPPWKVRGLKNGLGDPHGMRTKYLYSPQPISSRNGHCSGPQNEICTADTIFPDPIP